MKVLHKFSPRNFQSERTRDSRTHTLQLHMHALTDGISNCISCLLHVGAVHTYQCCEPSPHECLRLARVWSSQGMENASDQHWRLGWNTS